MNTEPMKKYLQALEAHKNKDDSVAAQRLAESVGLSAPTSIIRDSVANLADPDNPNPALITLMMHEMEK